MGVRIAEIQIQSAGPIRRFSMKPGLFNVIWGLNELGKTHVVEFLIQTLFKQTRAWGLRQTVRTGRVTLEGISSKPVVLAPNREERLEDFWEKDGLGLPSDFSQLLVVRGAETALDEKGGVDKAVLKKFLSHQHVLDTIDKRISSTVQGSRVEGGQIIAPKRVGLFKDREEVIERKKQLQELFHQVDETSGGVRSQLKHAMVQCRQKLEDLHKAKRHAAFLLDREMKELNNRLNRMDENRLKEIRSSLSLYKHQMREYEQHKKQLEDARNRSRDFEWLKNAAQTIEMNLQQGNRKVPAFLPAGALCLILAGVLLFFGPRWSAAALLGIGLLLLLVYWLALPSWMVRLKRDEEMRRIQEDFESRLKKKYEGLPHIKTLVQSMEEDYGRSKHLLAMVEEEKEGLRRRADELREAFAGFEGKSVEPSEWEDHLKRWETRQSELRETLRVREKTLASLNVDPSDFEIQPANSEYSKQAIDAAVSELENLERRLKQEDDKIGQLKDRIRHLTAAQDMTDWESLVQALRDKIDETSLNYKEVTAEILGKIAVHRVIGRFRMAEDEKIHQGLQSANLAEMLKKTTGRYSQLRLEGDRLYVGDADEYALQDLSTGAQEQVLLALRLSFSSGLSKQPMFLILDDAFQYSDWERRVSLVDTVASLAESGWQILYFTMDNHIRDLFVKRGKAFKNDFQSIVLGRG